MGKAPAFDKLVDKGKLNNKMHCRLVSLPLQAEGRQYVTDHGLGEILRL